MWIEVLKNKGIKLALIWLLVVNIIGLIANNRLNLNPDDAYSWIPIEKYDQRQSWSVAGLHYRWDSGWYYDVVKNGYQERDAGASSNVVFFPIYPLLLKSILFFGGNFIWAGWFLSSLFLILSCGFLFKFIQEFHKNCDPLLAVFLLLIFPTSFFLNAIYTESMFLFFSLASFYFSFKRKYFLAGIFGFLASLTRITGVLLFLPLLIKAFSVEGLNYKTLRKIWPLSLIVIGFFSFFAFHWIKFGNPLLFFEVESAWGRSFSINRDHFIFLTNASMVNFWLDSFYLIFGIAVSLYFLKIKNYAYFIYMASTIGVAVASGTLMSIGRYILILFPIFILGSSFKNEIGKYAWILVSAMLMALNTYLFVNWYWAG